MSTIITFDPAAFRANPQFAAYSQNPPYTDVLLNAYFAAASTYISNKNGGCFCGFMSLERQTQALDLMVAHLIFISLAAQSGDTPGIVTGATIDKVSVTIAEPPLTNQWQYWLSSSPYGQQLLALLQIAGVGGQIYGGRYELLGFRRGPRGGC